MPFIKITKGKNKGKYRSPSGRIFTQKQVNLYYHHDGFPKKGKRKTRKGGKKARTGKHR